MNKVKHLKKRLTKGAKKHIINKLMINELTKGQGMNEKEKREKLRRVCRLFICTDRQHRKKVESFAAELGVHRSQHFVLMRIADAGGSASQKELAERLEISPAALAVTLKKLESGGYLEKKPTESDSRHNDVSLTEKGWDVRRVSEEKFARIDAQMFDGFSDAELETLIGFLERMQRNLRADDEPSSVK
ncbi:MAG: MarR family transcriptional regulator [Ruminococcaceae bacterium]|nr:MarR family transcriptional regulator [Oscillospiraceae bacterium]